jgi:hypothetical protein
LLPRVEHAFGFLENLIGELARVKLNDVHTDQLEPGSIYKVVVALTCMYTKISKARRLSLSLLSFVMHYSMDMNDLYRRKCMSPLSCVGHSSPWPRNNANISFEDKRQTNIDKFHMKVMQITTFSYMCEYVLIRSPNGTVV